MHQSLSLVGWLAVNINSRHEEYQKRALWWESNPSSAKRAPRRGIEPRSPAWQAGILATILSRICCLLWTDQNLLILVYVARCCLCQDWVTVKTKPSATMIILFLCCANKTFSASSMWMLWECYETHNCHTHCLRVPLKSKVQIEESVWLNRAEQNNLEN